jgi:hypothetical protein
LKATVVDDAGHRAPRESRQKPVSWLIHGHRSTHADALLPKEFGRGARAHPPHPP